MTETLHPARGGWQQEETDLLWKEIRAAAESGAPLRGVFERMGQVLGRKPNSVRNYYYMQLRDQAGDELRRAAPFETFTEQEIHDLVRKVLLARGKGQSVRACVTELSGGDKTLMLRYQNKYRSVLRKRPDMIATICQELQAEGLPCPQEPAAVQPLPAAASAGPADPDVQTILSALQSLVVRTQRIEAPESDRLKVQRDLLMMQLEDVQLAARALIADCKEFLGEPEEDRPLHLSEFCDTLAGHVARLESISG
ncbi:MAG: hypothetical protein IJ189_10605 [Clostridia bacterium]|nr:hypothetical protein [Clostridia bacterium]